MLTMTLFIQVKNAKSQYATSGNRTRAARVAGEHSTTEPTLLTCWVNWKRKAERDEKKKPLKMFSQSVGFEPTLPEGI